MNHFANKKFAPVMNYPDSRVMKVFDLSNGLNEKYIRSFEWGIGKYNEKREGMYTAEQFDGRRNIHMGIDIWSRAERPVFSFTEGIVAYLGDNNQAGDYGPTLVLKYAINDQKIFALYGHLSKMTLNHIEVGETVKKGQQIATIGTEKVNGGWPPHLHFQLSKQDPGKPDMPGVVSKKDHQRALETYPDPRTVLGPLY
jgi:murein DD-endopeptidase MepM/ murein hydrolase activator NlpD